MLVIPSYFPTGKPSRNFCRGLKIKSLNSPTEFASKSDEHSESTFSGEFPVINYRASDGKHFLLIVLYFDRTLIRVLCQVCCCYKFLFPRIQRHYISITFQASSIVIASIWFKSK